MDIFQNMVSNLDIHVNNPFLYQFLIYNRYDFLLKKIAGLTFYESRIPLLPPNHGYLNCSYRRSPTTLQWARDASGGCIDQRRDLHSCSASGRPQILHRWQDEIMNKSPIAMEKQRS